MKLPILLCALILSINGWCASITPTQRTAHAITLNHQTIENEKLQEEISRPLLADKMKKAMIGWVLISYLTAIIWWAIRAKTSLDIVLKDVLQGIAQYC